MVAEITNVPSETGLEVLRRKKFTTGYKTIDSITDIPVIYSLLTTLDGYYYKIRDHNPLFRGLFNLAFLSLATVLYFANPVINYFKTPIDKVDKIVGGSIEIIKNEFPVISKPTEELTKSAQEIYGKTLKEPVEKILTIKSSSWKFVTDLKDVITKKVTDVFTLGKSALNFIIQLVIDGLKKVESVLETTWPAAFKSVKAGQLFSSLNKFLKKVE